MILKLFALKNVIHVYYVLCNTLSKGTHIQILDISSSSLITMEIRHTCRWIN